MRRVSIWVALAMLLAACETDRPSSVPPVPFEPPATAAASPSSSQPAPPPGPDAPSPTPAVVVRTATVTRVVDGDTAHMSIGGVVEKVRFIGIDTPESTTRREPYGAEASAYTKKVLAGKTVWLETDAELRDRFGRLLAYVWLTRPVSGDEAEVRRSMLNARLLLDGYAQVATFPPNVRYVDLFVPMQREAREAGRGLWGLSEPRAQPASGKAKCDPSYPDVCIPPPPPDLDCGDIPHERFRVVGADPHRFDGDGDGIGCES